MVCESLSAVVHTQFKPISSVKHVKCKTCTMDDGVFFPPTTVIVLPFQAAVSMVHLQVASKAGVSRHLQHHHPHKNPVLPSAVAS